MRMEFQLVPTIQMDIELLPSIGLLPYVSEILKMRSSERVREKLIRSLGQWEFLLRSERRSVMVNKDELDRDIILQQIVPVYEGERELTEMEKKEYLKRVYVNSYYTFNFICPEIGLENEVFNTREKFLEIMSKQPYHLSYEGGPIGLNLYHRHPVDGPSEYDDYAVPADIGLSTLISHPGEPAYQDSALQKQVNSLALEALRESSSKKKRRDLSSQLKLLIAGYINPRMFGVQLVGYLQTKVPEIYAQQSKKNGDFEMPLPKCLS